VDQSHKLGVSYVGVYSYSQKQYYGFVEEDLHKLEKIFLAEKPMLIGFNSLHFDNAVLQPYFQDLDLSQLPHLDMLVDIEKQLGHRLKLDSIAQTTLFTQKSGDGLDAVRWYRQGNMEALAKYCLDDVAITKDVYEYGLRHGRVYYMTGGQKTPVNVSWCDEIVVQHMIEEAFKKHHRVKVTYIDIENPGTPQQYIERKTYHIDVLGLQGDLIDAFVEELQEKRQLHLSQIWECEVTDEVSAHQATMF
jgi:hypothetical protein